MAGESGQRVRVGDGVRRQADGLVGPVNKVVALTMDGRYALLEVTSAGVTVRAWQPVKTLTVAPWDEDLGVVG